MNFLRLALTTTLFGLAMIAPSSASPILIMPLGDSLTVADSGSQFTPGGYRNHLFENLTSAGFTVQLVGSQTTNASNYLTSNSQTNHEGHSGYLIEGNSNRSGLRENLGTYFSLNSPSIIILMIGTNDVIDDYDLANAPARLGRLLDDITTLVPNATILLSSIPYTLDPVLNTRVTTYNAALPGVANARSNVRFSDIAALISPPNDYGDVVHLSTVGYDKLGDHFSSEILTILEAPEPATVLVVPAALLLFWRKRLLAF